MAQESRAKEAVAKKLCTKKLWPRKLWHKEVVATRSFVAGSFLPAGAYDDGDMGI